MQSRCEKKRKSGTRILNYKEKGDFRDSLLHILRSLGKEEFILTVDLAEGRSRGK